MSVENNAPLSRRYDVIVIGGRCAGAAVALNLARAGMRVLVVEKGAPDADTVSTHALMRGGVLQLRRWGLLDRIAEAPTPPVRVSRFHYVSSSVPVAIGPRGGVDALYAPRRTLLDRVLVDAARSAGADVRHHTALTALVHRNGKVGGVSVVDRNGRHATIDADLVVGADGVRSKVAALAGARTLVSGVHASALAYGYFRGLPADAYRWFWRPGACAGVIPTNGGKACVFAATDPARFRRELADGVESAFARVFADAAPEIAGVTTRERRDGLLRSFRGERGVVREAYGAGWALVGDAGFFKDPLTAHGITDALRDAELLARGIVRGSLHDYQTVRDELAFGMLRVSDALASFAWDDERVQALLYELAVEMKRGVEVVEGIERAAAA